MKIYEKYKMLKAANKEKMYLFKNGNFYIFLEDDANKINEYMVLKKTPFTKDTIKCGFPISRLEDYQKVFQNHKLPIEIVEPETIDNSSFIESQLEKINIETITPIEALQILYELKGACHENRRNGNL